jgi:hypothetical protein
MMQFFKMAVCPYTQQELLTVGLRSTKMHFATFPGQHNHQTSSDRCGQFWRAVRSRFPPPPSLKQLEDVPHEERYSIALETIQN